MNPILRILTTSALFSNSAMSLVTPIMAIFIADELTGGSIAAAGYATTIYLATKAVVQMAVGRYTDGDEGCLREYYTALLGRAMFVVIPFTLIFLDHVWELYVIQFIAGVAAAFVFPGWTVLFTRFADRHHEGREWTAFNTFVILGSALAASAGGWLADHYGFSVIFLLWGTLQACSLITFLSLGRHHTELREGCTMKRRKHIVHAVDNA
jgi:MFS family permease